VLALKRSDLAGGELRIDESALNGVAAATKNQKTRFAPVPASLRAELEDWIARLPEQGPDAVIFPNAVRRMGRRSGLRTMLVRARTSASIPDLDFRMCRRTFATLYEGDVKDVQEILGHHSAELTMEHYKKAIPERQRQAVEELDRRLAKVIPIRKKA
jgi:integrase